MKQIPSAAIKASIRSCFICFWPPSGGAIFIFSNQWKNRMTNKAGPAPNNIYFGCPGVMADNGRTFTDFRSCNNARCHAASSFDERMWFQRNATQLMNSDWARAFTQCRHCFSKNEAGTMLPEMMTERCTNSTCTTVESNHCGLGTGRDYVTPQFRLPLSGQGTAGLPLSNESKIKTGPLTSLARDR